MHRSRHYNPPLSCRLDELYVQYDEEYLFYSQDNDLMNDPVSPVFQILIKYIFCICGFIISVFLNPRGGSKIPEGALPSLNTNCSGYLFTV